MIDELDLHVPHPFNSGHGVMASLTMSQAKLGAQK